MKKKSEKAVTCPNCFGTDHREVLATATSRNIVDDDSADAAEGCGLSGEKRREVVKLFCIHCGHELHRQGNRA
jgi:transposase